MNTHGLEESAAVRRINAQCAVALHVPTNHRYRIVMLIEGVGVELEDMERRERHVNWSDWNNPNIWSTT